MKTRLLIVLVAVVVLAAAMTGSVFAQSNSAFLNSFNGGGYSAASSAPVGVLDLGLEEIAGGTLLGALGSLLGPVGTVSGAALGVLGVKNIKTKRAQAPREYREWYYDSTVQRDGWRVWGHQYTVVPMENTPPMRVWGRPQLPQGEQRFEEPPAQPIEP